jgi:glycosyl hydrolase family 39 (putative alpha-L-iduronidase)
LIKHSSIADGGACAQRMKMLYGFNEIDGWAAFSMGEHREEIHRRLRLMGTKVVRVFVFDKPVPDPIKEWHWFAAVLQSVLDVGAKPMVTFAKFHPPYDDPRNIRSFVARCSEIVWSCIEQWGGQEVKDWYWCIWNEPNNPDVGGNVSYSQYRRIYEEVAPAILDLLEPYLGSQKAKIGGPAIDGTQRLYWMDWIAQLVADVDDRLIGFASWHMYADWRPAAPSETTNVKLWDASDSPNGEAFESLVMAQTPQYEARARGVARLLHGRSILNVCGELNTVAHHEHSYTLGLNQNAFGAAYYASALINLIRGGADLEMRWTATSKKLDWGDRDDAYGLMSISGEATPACVAKQLFAQHVQYGDWIRFPGHRLEAPNVDSIVAWHDDGRRSGLFVHTGTGPRVLRVSDWDNGLGDCEEVLRMDSSTGTQISREPFDGTIRLDGYGVAVVTNAATETDKDGN